jgi:hypothetical protein
MKRKQKLTLEEIVKGWGSLEAYLEEQRRTGICELETKAFEIPANNSSQLTFFARTKFSEPELDQAPVLPELALSNPVELTLLQSNHLAFIRWLYVAGRLES